MLFIAPNFKMAQMAARQMRIPQSQIRFVSEFNGVNDLRGYDRGTPVVWVSDPHCLAESTHLPILRELAMICEAREYEIIEWVLE